MEQTRALYADLDVAFEPIVPRPDNEYIVSQVRAPTWTFHDWLRAREETVDVVHISDWHGLGYGSLLAKSLGLAFGATHFVVHGHGPTLWVAEGNRQLLSTERELGWVFMERRSVELADTVISSSSDLLRWMRASGYAVPARSFVWPTPSPTPDTTSEAVAGRETRDGATLEEVVFFGRLEPREGLVLFIDAIDRLVRRRLAPTRVTFLGKPSPGLDGLTLIRRVARHWPVQIRTITDYEAEEEVAYLSQPGRLAVLPSLQKSSSLAVVKCLNAGIPFIAAATDGTPGLIAPEDHVRALVAPDHVALGEGIVALATAPLRAIRPRTGLNRSLEVWSNWHAQNAPFETASARFSHRERATRTEAPPVTVCIVHHERPALVRMAVDSVFAQDYPELDAVLVDDGSESAEAQEAMRVIEVEFVERGWSMIRQENRFLGAARNAAVAATHGEWILFLDDDNLLFPDAVSRLVHAALFAGADCVPAASIRFFGDGDPRTDTASHGSPIRFLGAARAWNRIRNVIGDACALVRREAFQTVGGFDEERHFALSDLSFFTRLVVAGYRVEPMPDPVYYYRMHLTSMMSTMSDHRIIEANRVRVLASHLRDQPDEERAFAAYAMRDASAAKTTASQQLQEERVMRIAIIVAGMHRSGTSALTRVLSIAGCHLPSTLIRPERYPGNSTGFWESQSIVDLNQEILASAGSSWDDWRPFAQDWHMSPTANEFRERARELIQQEFGSNRLFVLKDPRMCRLLEFWLEVVDASGVQPLVVSPIRHPLDVASSLQVRDGIDQSVGQLLWLRHVLDAEAASRKVTSRTFLRYEQLLSEAHTVVSRIGKDLGVSWPRESSPYAEMEIEEFLSPVLHHHNSDDSIHRANPHIPEWIGTVFDIFDRWSNGEGREEDIPDLDRIKAAFDEATPTFSRAMVAGRRAERKNGVLLRKLEDYRRELEDSRRELDESQRELEDSRRQLAEHDHRIRILSEQIEKSRKGHVMAFSHRRSRIGTDELEINILLNPEWLNHVKRIPEHEPVLQLRRNGRRMAQTFVLNHSHNCFRTPLTTRLHAIGDTFYSIHDSVSGEVLAGLTIPSIRRSRLVVGAVENREHPEVRGWVLDQGSPERTRRVAIHVDGHFREVVIADQQRADIARWKGTGGRHGFHWWIPESMPVEDGTFIDVFDADTGQSLRGSPVRIEAGKVIANEWRRT